MLALIGLLVRLPFIPLIGFRQDFQFLVSWADYLVKSSPITIYADYKQISGELVNYPPVYLFILTLLARFFRSLSTNPFDCRAFLILIKCVTISFEALTGYVLYHWSTKRWDKLAGLWAFGLYFLNPAIIYVGSYYGQLDAIFSAFLVLAIVALADEKPFWSGSALAMALLIKIQTIPFVPLFFGMLLVQRRMREFGRMLLGFSLTGLVILSPYILHNQLQALLNECVWRSVQWGKFVSVGAFNLWYLHADPVVFDGRIWGLFFDREGALRTNGLLNLLTYKNLGTALFGCAFLATWVGYWRSNDRNKTWIAAMHVALAFFMLPTTVHERYLFPYFVFAAPLAASDLVRRFFFFAFSLTYLVNLMVVCPLFGQSVDVREIDTPLGVTVAFVNVMLYAGFIVYEYVIPYFPKQRLAVATRAIFPVFVGCAVLLVWRSYARQTDPNVLYLSQLTPISVEQSWPLLNKKGPRPGYGQLQADLSTDGRQIQIGDTVYRYGLGAHAISRVEYNVPAKYKLFECYAGVDAEALQKYRENPDVGTVTFTVWVNGQHMFATPLTIPTTPPRRITVPLLSENEKGTNRISLVVDGTADGVDSDHADWALARVFRITP